MNAAVAAESGLKKGNAMLKKSALVKASLVIMVFAAGYALGSFNLHSDGSTDVIPEANASRILNCPKITRIECRKFESTGDQGMYIYTEKRPSDLRYCNCKFRDDHILIDY